MNERPFSDDERQRYSRHFVLPEVGEAGQRRMREASVAIVGAGGLGVPVALYLAASGVGRIAIVDGDRVERSNLPRQVLYTTDDIGRPKVAAAADALRRRNPHVSVETFELRLTAANALDLLRPYDVVVDATDTYASHYLLNDACALLRKPDVMGSVYRFEGEVSVFDAQRGPCYRCIHPEPPPPHLAVNCSESGVLGVLPGVIGTLQAAEVVKLIAGVGVSLVGSVLLVDLFSGTFLRIGARKSESCALCGPHPTITALADRDERCATDDHEEKMNSLSVEQVKQMMDAGSDFVLLDVREPGEYALANLRGTLIPLGELQERFRELDGTKEVVVYCHTGVRSARAVAFLESRGFPRVYNLAGGIAAWSRRIDPTIPEY